VQHSSYTDPAEPDWRRAAQDPATAQLATCQWPGPAGAHRHTAAEQGLTAALGGALTAGHSGSPAMVRLDRGGRVERGEQDGVVPVHHLSPLAAEGEWWRRKGARWWRGIGGADEVELLVP
jgi:hypothetical protein